MVKIFQGIAKFIYKIAVNQLISQEARKVLKNKKVEGFIKSIINMAADKGMSEEEFTSAIDTARKIIRKNPISKDCLENTKLSDDNVFGEIEVE